MITVKVKARSGEINTVQYEEILEIDGVPFRGTADDHAAVLQDHETRLSQCEALLGQAIGGRLNGSD